MPEISPKGSTTAATASAATLSSPGREEWWPRDKIVPSKTNPRKRFDEGKLAELADNIKKHGILQPILARPLPRDPDHLEIIAGERRYRAAGLAGLDQVPVRIVEVNDLDMLELQIVENLQRQDLHELEEAESYEALLAAHKGDDGYGVDEIAAKVGKSRAYVYARLKLCALGEQARQAFYDGKLNASTALLLARIPVAELQLDALKEITEGWAGPMAFRDAAAHIQRNYMLRLDQAKFKISDVTLVPAAGACGDCPKRTGANPDLFSDVGRADVCTDPTCFNAKKDAHAERLRAAAIESGMKVITGAEAKKAKPHSYSDDLVGYVRPDERCWQVEGNKTYAKLLGKDAPQPVLIEDPHKGEMIKAYPLDAVKVALRAKGHEVSRAKSEHTDKARKEEERVKAMRAHRRAVLQRIHDAAGERMAAGETLSHDDLRLIAAAALDRLASDHEGPIKDMWQISRERGEERENAIAQLEPNDLALLLLDLALVPHAAVGIYWNQSEPKTLWAVARRYGIDPAAVKREVDAEARAKQKAKAAGAKPKRTDKAASPAKGAPKAPPRKKVTRKPTPAETPASATVGARQAGEPESQTATENSSPWPYPTAASMAKVQTPTTTTQARGSLLIMSFARVGMAVQVAQDAKDTRGRRSVFVGRTGTIEKLNESEGKARVKWADGKHPAWVSLADLVPPVTPEPENADAPELAAAVAEGAEPSPADQTEPATDGTAATDGDAGQPLAVGTRIRVREDARGPAGMRLKCRGRVGTVAGEEDGRHWVKFDDESFHADLRREHLDVLGDAATPEAA